MRTAVELTRPVTIVIPAYGAADRLAVCLNSLFAQASRNASIYVVDDCTPDESIKETCERANADSSRVTYIRQPENKGFVETCNWTFHQLRAAGSDLLLLNSDTEVTENFLEEMQAVLDLDEKHAAVCPRSNNATIFSIPPIGARLSPEESFAAWQSIRTQLPRFQVAPTAVGFCLLLKATVLDRFGILFDPIYSPGYNEENDFICFINQYGYSAVFSNWSFVYHYESSSFSSRRAELEDKNREILDSRYPDYSRKVDDYVKYQIDPVEFFAALAIPHRPRLLFDVAHIGAAYNGTSEYALNLLRGLRAHESSAYDLYVGLQPGHGMDFFLRELRGYNVYEHGNSEPEVFDLVFRPSQFFWFRELEQLNRVAPRIAFTLQDIIGLRCEYLNSAYRRQLFRVATEEADAVFSISEYTRHDFISYYGFDLPMTVIHHGTDIDLVPMETGKSGYVLVIGNHYAHKAVADLLNYLGDEIEIVVLGGSDRCRTGRNINRYPSGHLTKQRIRSLYAGAKLIVYPSHYEGFGLPVIDALALGKPVIALNTEINRELAAMTMDQNLHLVETFQDFLPAINRVAASIPSRPSKTRSWTEVAGEYDAEFRRILRVDVDSLRLRRRWKTLADIRAIGAAADETESVAAPAPAPKGSFQLFGGRKEK